MNKLLNGLYLNGQRADTPESFNIAFTIQNSDTASPESVKVNFSKSITLQGTKTNNSIFNSLCETEANFETFNPNVRNEFVLYNNGDIVEIGYFRLESIDRKDNDYKYTIVLFGGIGDFFYTLRYNEDGSEKSLNDLYFGFNDINYTKVLSVEEENTEILTDWSAEFIGTNWNRLKEGKEVEIVAVPTLQGLYDDFNNSMILTYKSDGTPIVTEYDDFEFTEWEANNLISSKQRPAIKLTKLLEAIQNPINNGGYDVVYDPDFYDTNTPLGIYVQNSWVLLPKLDFEGDEYIQEAGERYLIPNNVNPVSTSNINTITYNVPSIGGYRKFAMNMNIQFAVEDKDGNGLDRSLLEDYTYIAPNASTISYFSLFILRLKTPKRDIVNVYTNGVVYNWATDDITPLLAERYGVESRSIKYITNKLVKDTSNEDINNHYTFQLPLEIGFENVQDDEIGTYQLSFDFINVIDDAKYIIEANKLKNHWVKNVYVTNPQYRYDGKEYNIVDNHYIIFNLDSDVNGFYNGTNNLIQRTSVYKSFLFSSTRTPMDYLLDFTKMFNLRYRADNKNKKIYIEQLKNYYQYEIVNIDDRIDYSQSYKILPRTTTDKILYFNPDTPESDIVAVNNKKYKTTLGGYKFKTKYAIDGGTKELFTDNIYQNIADDYQPTHENKSKSKTSNYKTNTETENPRPETPIKYTETSPLPKLCLYDNENKEVEADNSLVFFNGFHKSIWLTDFNAEDLVYTQSDEQCFVHDERKKKVSYPTFSRTLYDAGYNPIVSYYIGEPNTYVGNRIGADRCIFNQFFKNYYNDVYDANAKKVECSVFMLLNTNVKELLRKFYFFQNSYWVLEKIVDYNPYSVQTTKCTFVKVKNINNYLS